MEIFCQTIDILGVNALDQLATLDITIEVVNKCKSYIHIAIVQLKLDHITILSWLSFPMSVGTFGNVLLINQARARVPSAGAGWLNKKSDYWTWK